MHGEFILDDAENYTRCITVEDLVKKPLNVKPVSNIATFVNSCEYCAYSDLTNSEEMQN